LFFYSIRLGPKNQYIDITNNRPAFQDSRFTIGGKGFRSRGANEKCLSMPKARSKDFVLTHTYSNYSPEECRKRLRAEFDTGTFEPHSDCSSPLRKQSRAFSIFNAKVISVLGFSPEVSKELDPENIEHVRNTGSSCLLDAPTKLEQETFQQASGSHSCLLDYSSSSSDTLDFDLLDELQDFDWWCNETTL